MSPAVGLGGAIHEITCVNPIFMSTVLPDSVQGMYQPTLGPSCKSFYLVTLIGIPNEVHN